ncbi:MAG: hypothetical protein QOE62_3178 [Actinomycetota bacterium]|nr:hypothetical protein [Actinomycetota bacterium]
MRGISPALGVLLPVIIALASCGSGSTDAIKVRTPDSATSPTTVASPFVVDPPVSAVTTFHDGQLIFAPPRASDAPTVDSSAAYSAVRANPLLPGRLGADISGPPTLQLARVTIKDFGKVAPDRGVTLFIADRFVWVVWHKSVRIPITTMPGQTPPSNAPTSSIANVVTFVDANTSDVLDTQVFSR